MRTPIVLLASGALLLPTAVVAASAEAADSTATTATIRNCYKTRHGVTVRVRLRDMGGYTRVRVSHPDGKGSFRNRHVKRVFGGAAWYNAGATATTLPRGHKMSPSTRVKNGRGPSTVDAYVSFHLRNGHAIRMFCSLHES